MNGSNDSSEFDALLTDPEFRAELDAACRRAFRRYPDNEYDSPEDLAQDVFMRARARFKTSLSQYRKIARTNDYLYRIAINALIDAFRAARAGKRPPLRKALSLDGSISIRDESEKQIEYKLLLKEILQGLNSDERKIIIECGLKGKRLSDMAKELGISAPTMKTRYMKLLTKIRRRLESNRNDS